MSAARFRKVAVLRAAEARWLLSHHRREHLPQSPCRHGVGKDRTRRRSTDAGEAIAAEAPAGFQGRSCRRGAGAARTLAAYGDRKRQYLRSPDGRRCAAAPWAKSLTPCTTSAAVTAATCRIDMPPDPEAAIKAVLAAVQSGRLVHASPHR